MKKFFKKTIKTLSVISISIALAGCIQTGTYQSRSHDRMIGSLETRLIMKHQKLGNPIFVRIFKEENELEVWMQSSKGKYERFGVYPICKFSGQLGPKIYQGDMQSPEGFYAVSKRGMKVDSQYYRSFNLGFPNAFDKAHNRTGTYLMVHGDCKSVGCYAMTDRQISEIYQLADNALNKGQPYFKVHAFPFRMTNERMERAKHHRHYAFWQQLKAGYDAFENRHIPPNVEVVNGRYVVR